MIENGIIKIKTVGGVTYGITLDDLRQTFGVSGNSMGAILQVANVNPWAKYKPIKNATLGRLTAAIRKSEDQGFVNIHFQTPTACFERAKTVVGGSVANWEYQPPIGGINVSPFRLMDFANDSNPSDNGYNRAARNPFYLEQVYTDPADSQQDVKVEVIFRYMNEEIALSDIGSVDTFATQTSGTWYWCLFAKVPTRNYVECWHLYTDQTYTTRLTIGSPSASARHGFTHFTAPEIASGTVEAYLGLVCIDDLEEPGRVRYIYAPTLQAASFDLTNPTGAFYVSLVPQSQNTSGMVITYSNTGEYNEIVALETSLEITYIGPGDPVIHIHEEMRGYVNGQEMGYEHRDSTLTTTASIRSMVIDGAWQSFEGVICDSALNARYTIRVEVGSSAYVYMYFIGSPDLRKTDDHESMLVGDLVTLNNQDYTYVEIIDNTQD